MTGLRVSMFTPWRIRCGITDYSHFLIEQLREQEDIAKVRIVEPPEQAVRLGTLEVLRQFQADDRRFFALGKQMGMEDAQIAHIQHQYFFFGGVAPHKNHMRAFLAGVQIPIVMTVHEIAQQTASASALIRCGIARTNRTNLLDDRIRQLMVHTTADREALIALGISAKRVTVVTHGIPPALPMPDPQHAKHKLGLDGRTVLTLFGFLSAKKGHEIAIDATTRMSENVTLLLAGDRHPDDRTEYVPLLRQRIAKAGLEERVRITGYLPSEDIPTVMAATDIALAPFIHSSGSGSLATLLAYGRAIVASDIAPHRELEAAGQGCLVLFPTENVEALAAVVQKLLNAPGRRLELQANARSYALRHSYADMARETIAVYRTVLEGP